MPPHLGAMVAVGAGRHTSIPRVQDSLVEPTRKPEEARAPVDPASELRKKDFPVRYIPAHATMQSGAGREERRAAPSSMMIHFPSSCRTRGAVRAIVRKEGSGSSDERWQGEAAAREEEERGDEWMG